MKPKYNQLFDQISPTESDDELLQAVFARKAENMNMTNTNTKRKIIRKAVIIPIAATLALSATAVGVGAAYNWDFSQIFQSFYSQRAEDGKCLVDTNIDNQTLNADLSSMGKNLGLSFDFEYGTVNFTGVIADSSILFLTYELNVNEDFIEQYYEKYNAAEKMYGAYLIHLNSLLTAAAQPDTVTIPAAAPILWLML